VVDRGLLWMLRFIHFSNWTFFFLMTFSAREGVVVIGQRRGGVVAVVGVLGDGGVTTSIGFVATLQRVLKTIITRL